MQSSGIDFFIYYHIFANDSRYSAPIHFSLMGLVVA